MIDHFLIRSADKRTSGGGEETPMLGVASYTNCVGYTCPPEGPRRTAANCLRQTGIRIFVRYSPAGKRQERLWHT